MMKADAPITGGISWPPVEPTDFDRRRAIGREAGPDHGRDGDDADRQHVADRAARDHAEQRRADDRDLAGAAAETAHGRHGDVGEEVGAAGARQHLAQDRERDHDQHRHLQDRADDAVDVEAEVDDQPLGRDGPRLERAGEVRADEDVDRHRHDDARRSRGRRCAGSPPARAGSGRRCRRCPPAASAAISWVRRS